jgi:hypothetical protein
VPRLVLKQRLIGRRGADTDPEGAEYKSMLAREAARRYAPEIALYVTSVLLACVVGISVALYLK